MHIIIDMKKIKEFIKKHKLLTIQLGIMLFLIFSLVLLSILKTNKDICESWTRGLGQFHSAVFGTINEWIPFSITEVLMISTIIGIVTLLVLSIINLVKKKVWEGIGKLMTITLTILSILTLYNATFEMGYNRKPLDLPLYQKQVKEEKFYQIVEYFIDDLNSCVDELEFREDGEVINPYSNKELNKKLKEEYKKLDSDYYGSYTPRVKEMMTSFIYTAFGITGWFFGPTGEAAVNYKTTNGEKPMSYAHEMAHSKGVSTEDGAQMVASYICLNSEDKYIRYSGYINTLASIMKMANFSDVDNAYNTLYHKINTKVWKNYDYLYKFWDKSAFMLKVGDVINDWYLKISGQKDGTSSYQDNPPVIDDQGKVISLSRYQKLVVQIYADHFPSELD